MGLFSHRRKSEDLAGLHADPWGTALVRVGMLTARRTVVRASAFSPGDGDPENSESPSSARQMVSPFRARKSPPLSGPDPTKTRHIFRFVLVLACQSRPDIDHGKPVLERIIRGDF